MIGIRIDAIYKKVLTVSRRLLCFVIMTSLFKSGRRNGDEVCVNVYACPIMGHVVGLLIEFGGIGSVSNRNNINRNSLNIGYEMARSIYYFLNGRYPTIEKYRIVPELQSAN
jgi:hypothetical protein